MTASESQVFRVCQANGADLEQYNLYIKTKSWYRYESEGGKNRGEKVPVPLKLLERLVELV
jgi:hypothetical protein